MLQWSALFLAAVLGAQTVGVGPARRMAEITGTPLGAAVLDAEDARAPTPQHMSVLVEGTKAADERVRLVAIRALGRLEKRELLPVLLPFVRSTDADERREAIQAAAQAMRGEAVGSDAAGRQQIDELLNILVGAARAEKDPFVMLVLGRALGRLPYERPEHVRQAEQMLTGMLDFSKLRVDIKMESHAATVIAGALSGLELLARLQQARHPLSEGTIDQLRSLAAGRSAPRSSSEVARVVRPYAFSALIAARGVDEDVLRANLTYDGSVDVRRLATQLVSGGASPITGAERGEAIRQALQDRAPSVRYEAVRGFARHQTKEEGCLPLLQAASDSDEHVALLAFDTLGDACPGDENVLMRLISEARTPPNVGSWRRESHALVSLAKQSRPHVEIPLSSHSRHNTWQVRMYAARAAAAADAIDVLERLAYDEHDNVREATLVPLKRLRAAAAEPHFVAALGRSDYQLLRTAARELAGLQVSRAVAEALADALARVSAQRRETSRDTRLALLERLEEFGTVAHSDRVRPLLRDFDPRVAGAAARVLTRWTEQTATAEPQPLPREPLPSPTELALLDEIVIILVLDSGKELRLDLDPWVAPLTATRFLRLARADYFDGLTFHRVVPNFIVQGGSPGANEYMGDGPYMRDEIGSRMNLRGTIGLSTRGRDTGDAQFFVNLVDNRRLDFDYTVFGEVSPKSLPVLDEIQEGVRITDVKILSSPRLPQRSRAP